MVDQEHTLPCGELYYIHPHHRLLNATIDKCVWTIPYQGELDCIESAIINNWIDGNKAWGLNNVYGQLVELGSNYYQETLRLAKFIKNGNQWHGYPADVNRRVHDRPTPNILTIWKNSNQISKSVRAKIQGGRL